MKINEEYILEKIEAYNVAIQALYAHESDSDPESGIAKILREKLALKLDREIQRWCDLNMKEHSK